MLAKRTHNVGQRRIRDRTGLPREVGFEVNVFSDGHHIAFLGFGLWRVEGGW